MGGRLHYSAEASQDEGEDNEKEYLEIGEDLGEEIKIFLRAWFMLSYQRVSWKARLIFVSS